MRVTETICIYCGKLITDRKPRQRICDECQKHKKENQGGKKKGKKSLSPIAEICKEAAEHGTSYGKYVATMGDRRE